MKKIIGIEEVVGKKKTTYRTSVMIDGIRMRRSFDTQEKALAWKNSIQIEREKNRQLGITTKNYISYNDLFQFFLDSKTDKRKTSIKVYNSTHFNHISPVLGKKSIKSLSMRDFDKIKIKLSKLEASNHLIKKVGDLLKSVLNFAVKRDYLDVNFMTKCESVKIDQSNYKYWRKEEIDSFLELVKNDFYYNLYVFALNTGLRRGEICGLKWSDIDFKSNTITLKRQRLSDGSEEGLKGHLTRSIPIFKNTLDSINRTFKRGHNCSNNNFVFLNKKNKPINPDNLTKVFKDRQKELKMENIINFHCMRHSFASFLATQNIPIQVIKELLGHKDIKVTQRYAHLSLGDIRNSVKALDL